MKLHLSANESAELVKRWVVTRGLAIGTGNVLSVAFTPDGIDIEIQEIKFQPDVAPERKS